MTFFDFPLDQLRMYMPPRNEPEDFDAFWERTISETKKFPLNARFEAVDFGLKLVEAYDVTFHGFGGQPIKGWLMMPAQRSGKLACVVEFSGYGGGRGFPPDHLLWSTAGYAHLIMDTRGQGSAWRNGDTGDPEPVDTNPHFPGFMTRGVLNPDTYYYRRVFTDAVRCVEAAQSHPAIDPERIAVAGGSQGGGISLAVSALSSAVKVAMPDVPFLCHYRRACQVSSANPYLEITKYLSTHRDKVDRVFSTLAYFDGVNFAPRIKAQTLCSVALMDEICPPSTVFAAYNYITAKKEIEIYEFNHHEGGGNYQMVDKVRYLNKVWN